MDFFGAIYVCYVSVSAKQSAVLFLLDCIFLSVLRNRERMRKRVLGKQKGRADGEVLASLINNFQFFL